MYKDFRKVFDGKEFEDFMNPERIKEVRVDALIKEYLDIVNKVIDDHRDKELSKLLFGEGTYSMASVIEIIDSHKEEKKKFEKNFRESVKVVSKEK